MAASAHPRWHELDNSDFGALPGAVPVVSREQRERHHHHGRHHQSTLPSPANATRLRFYQMQPQLDAEGALERQRPPWPPTQHKLAAFLVDQGGVRTHADNGGFARAASGPPGAPPAVPAPEEPPVGASAQRWQEKQPADVRVEATAPSVTANEDGRWYHMQSRLVPSDAPHVLATTPEERAVMAAQAAREAAAYAAPYQPGGATPWPEQERWYTLDRHARVRQQEAWEVPPERGLYDEWNVPAVGDATAPRFYDVPERWIHMAPVDDGSKGPLVPPGHGGVNLTNARPPEDGSKWYKIPNGNVKGGQWREC